MTKTIIIIVLKPDSGVNPSKDPGHVSRMSTHIYLGQHKIKVVIIIILKLDSTVNLEQGLV